MFINQAYAQDAADAAGPMAGGSLMTSVIWLVAMVALFYVLLIMPQKKRFKEHKAMLDGLHKGDKVVTAGGLVGTIDKIGDDADEVVLDMGNGTKLTALRSTLHQKLDASDKK